MDGKTIRFTDVFRDVCRDQLGIREEYVRQAIRSPDALTEAKQDDLDWMFFGKKRIRGKEELYLIVCVGHEGGDYVVYSAFPVRPDLVAETGSLDPLVLLQGLAQRFGLSIRIGSLLGKFIMQATVPVMTDDPAKLVEIRNPLNHSFAQAMCVRIRQTGDGKLLADIALAYCIDVNTYTAWLKGEQWIEPSEDNVVVEIAPQIKGLATARDLITPNGTLEFESRYSEMGGTKTGFLLKLTTRSYHLEIGFTSTHFYIIRNRHKLEWLLKPVFEPHGDAMCFAIWSPTELRLLILDEGFRERAAGLTREQHIQMIGQHARSLLTPATLPPNSLLQWARERAIAPSTKYESAQQFYGVVVESLQSIQDKIDSLGLIQPFWDITYDGHRIASRSPKRETDIHPTLHGLVFDIAIAKNLLVTPEHPIGGGKLDFLVTGLLTNGRPVPVCIEFKHAHSDDRINGLLKQLPAYMRSKGSEFGVYCVMYFRGEHFSEPKDLSVTDLELELAVHQREAGLGNIRILTLDMSHQASPSKL
jgi:hypothetical protein